MVDQNYPFTWRTDARSAGRAGALGDMASHVLSLAHYLVGGVVAVSGARQTLHRSQDAQGSRRSVENDDLTHFICRFANGASGYIEASRIGTGRKLYLAYEIQGKSVPALPPGADERASSLPPNGRSGRAWL